MYRVFLEKSQGPALLQPPVSKSDAIRSLLIRYAICEGMAPYPEESPDDVRRAQAAVAILESGEKEPELNLGLGGAPLRFFIAMVAMIPGLAAKIDAEDKLRQRPHGNLLDSIRKALTPCGLKLDDSSWPLKLDTRRLKLPRELKFQLEASSSQFLSGLLMAGARAIANDLVEKLEVELTSPLASSQYARMTMEWLEDAGFEVEQAGRCWKVTGYNVRPWDREAPVDWSSAAYLVTLAWRTGKRVQVSSLDGHPDSEILDILSQAGVHFNFECGSVVRATGELKKGLKADALNCPDLIPTLAMIALIAPEISVFLNVDILRDKESDRLQFIMDTVAAAGGKASYENGNLTITPGEKLKDIDGILTLDDHRRAMAAALLPALGDGNQVIIDDDKCVAKSFPSFWREAAKCGLKLEKKND